MRFKRIVFIGIAAGCVAVLALAMGGFFRRDEPSSQPPPSEGRPGEWVIANPSSQGENWTMQAEMLKVNAQQEMRFTKPTITYSQRAEAGKPERTVVVAAAEGFSAGEQADEMRLEKDVTARWQQPPAGDRPGESGVLRADELLWNKRTGTVLCAGPVEAAFTPQGRTHTAAGEGLRAELKAGAVTLERKVRLVLSGEVGLISAEPSGADSPEPPKTVITCDGPLTAEESGGTVKLQGNVVAARGDQVLKSDELVLHLVRTPEGQQAIERWLAQGNVLFASAQVELQGKRLLRAPDGQLTLVGNSPCTVKIEGMTIVAETVSIDLEVGRIVVPGPGKLTMEPKPVEGQPPPKPTTATWTGGMTFDRKEGKATFTQEVHVVAPDMEIYCRLLNLWLSADRSAMEKLQAEGDVRLTTPQINATGDSVLFLLKEQRLELKGEPSAKVTEKEHTVASPVIEMDRAAGRLSSKAAGTLTTTLAGEGQEKRQASVTWQKQMSFSEKEGAGRFEGAVALTDGARRLFGDAMQMKLSAGEKRDLESLDATGAVRINWEGRQAFGNVFHWEAEGGKGFLLGKPARVSFEQGWVRGEDIRFKNNFNEITVTGTKPAETSVERK